MDINEMFNNMRDDMNKMARNSFNEIEKLFKTASNLNNNILKDKESISAEDIENLKKALEDSKNMDDFLGKI